MSGMAVFFAPVLHHVIYTDYTPRFVVHSYITALALWCGLARSPSLHTAGQRATPSALCASHTLPGASTSRWQGRTWPNCRKNVKAVCTKDFVSVSSDVTLTCAYCRWCVGSITRTPYWQLWTWAWSRLDHCSCCPAILLV
jgi:hypothetical protein